MKHLSFSSYKLFHTDPHQFYIRYISPIKLPREPQNHYMAVGSAFDAYVKAALYIDLVKGSDPFYEFENLFNAQVESHNREVARKDGREVFDMYRHSGAYQSLLKLMENCVGPPRFEYNLSANIDGIILFGKPDISFFHRDGCRIVGDFKVNGFYSKTPPYAKSGYINMFPGSQQHGKAYLEKYRGITINAAGTLDRTAIEWAQQLTMYAWMLGEPVGGDYVLLIEQIVCNSINRVHRVARHCARVSTEFQQAFFEDVKSVWECANAGYVFRNLTYEENVMKCKVIDAELAVATNSLFNDNTRPR